MAYIVSQNSVITSLFVPSNTTFLTCGGTNIAPKVGTTWANFTASNPTTNFKYIFNSKNFNGGVIKPVVTGYPASGSTAPLTIKQFLFDGGNIEYVCGQFVITSPTTATNIMYFDPKAGTTTGTTTFNPLSSISFTGLNNTVNCMAFLNTLSGSPDTSKLVIAGNFSGATIGGNTSRANIALLTVTTTPTWSINTLIPIADSIINAPATTINSMIIIDNIIYIAGSDNTNCLFYSYDTTTPTWTNLLSSSPDTGTINILKKVVTQTNTYIAVGGQFTTLGSATVYNNIVLYNTVGGAWTSLGSGVTGVAASSPIYALPQVFALEYLESTNILWVGGYFLSANGTTCNSIAYYNINNNTWSVIDRKGDSGSPTVKGLLLDSGGIGGTDPGVVYALYISSGDTSNIIVGGSFITNTTPLLPLTTSTIIYNLVKITTATTDVNKRNYTKFNSLSQ